MLQDLADLNDYSLHLEWQPTDHKSWNTTIQYELAFDEKLWAGETRDNRKFFTYANGKVSGTTFEWVLESYDYLVKTSFHFKGRPHRCYLYGNGHYGHCLVENVGFGCGEAKCSTCVDLSYKLYPRGFEDRDGPDNYSTHSPDGRRSRDISTTVYNLRESSRRGCQKCTIIFEGLKRVCSLSSSEDRKLTSLTHWEVVIKLRIDGQ